MFSNPGRVLIVEDNYAIRLLFSEYLLTCGYQVMAVGTGLDLFGNLKEFRPDLLMLDLGLPDVDGRQLLGQLHQDNQWPHLRVVVVTGYAFEGDRQQAQAMGVQAYLVKPVRLSQLAQTIGQLLQAPTWSSTNLP